MRVWPKEGMVEDMDNGAGEDVGKVRPLMWVLARL